MPEQTSRTVEQEILALNGTCTQAEIASKFNISLPTIRKICRRNGVVWIWKQRDQTGDKNHNYKDGLGRSTIERTTRGIVLRSGRSLFCCERCEHISQGYEQHRHHKDRNRLNNNNENIEVLCERCHSLEHQQDLKRASNGQYVK